MTALPYKIVSIIAAGTYISNLVAVITLSDECGGTTSTIGVEFKLWSTGLADVDILFTILAVGINALRCGCN
jgi:hypothetical protein